MAKRELAERLAKLAEYCNPWDFRGEYSGMEEAVEAQEHMLDNENAIGGLFEFLFELVVFEDDDDIRSEACDLLSALAGVSA